MKDFKFKSTVSINYNNYNQLNYVPSFVEVGGFYGREDSQGGMGTQAQSTVIDVFFENTLTYDKEFNENHRLNVLAGTSWEDHRKDYFSASGRGYPDDDYLNNLSSASIAANVKVLIRKVGLHYCHSMLELTTCGKIVIYSPSRDVPMPLQNLHRTINTGSSLPGLSPGEFLKRIS